MDKLLDVASAASELGLSRERVRQLIGQGDLEAELIGHAWVINREDVRRRSQSVPKRGRPYGAKQAWRLAFLSSLANCAPASDKEVPGSASERWRLRKYLSELVEEPAPGQLASCLRHRSEPPIEAFVHPSLLEGLAKDERLVVSGARAAARQGSDLVDDSHVDAYVAPQDVQSLIDEYNLMLEVDNGNVRLRPSAQVSEWLDFSRGLSACQKEPAVAPLMLAIADLCDREDARADLAARELWDALRHELAGI